MEEQGVDELWGWKEAWKKSHLRVVLTSKGALERGSSAATRATIGGIVYRECIIFERTIGEEEEHNTTNVDGSL